MPENKVVYDAVKLPMRLFKYYGFDSKLTKNRLSGEAFLACPYDFNDPCDCQREVTNNLRERVKRKEWLKIKLQELGYDKPEHELIAESLLNGDDRLEKVHRRQLQRVGILCMTSNSSGSLMWGYYAPTTRVFALNMTQLKLLRQ